MKPLSIAVVGFGTAGGAASILLHDLGHKITLFEQAHSLGPIGAGVLLQPSGQMILQKMGLLSYVTRDAAPIRYIRAFKHSRKILAEFDFNELGAGCRIFGLHRNDLFSVLHREIEKRSVSLVLGKKIERAVQVQDRMEILDSTGSSHGEFDFVIAADGANSALRDNSNISIRKYIYPHGALWLNGHLDYDLDSLLQWTKGTELLSGILPTGKGRGSLFWSMTKAEYPVVLESGFSVWKDNALYQVPEVASILEPIKSLEDFKFITYSHVALSSCYSSGILFIGDAAHAMSPHTGQGINLALFDAYELAKVMSSAHNINEACFVYSRRRKSHIRFYSLLTATLSPLFQSPGIFKGLLRDLTLPWLHQLPLIDKYMLKSVSGLKKGVFGCYSDFEI